MSAVSVRISASLLAETNLRRSQTDDKKKLFFIVNPAGGNGASLQKWTKLAPDLMISLGTKHQMKISMTDRPKHAIDLAQEAAEEGADVIVAVGGDGTLNEVINGLFVDGAPVLPKGKGSSAKTKIAVGLIPLGTGSDFARTFGWKNGDTKLAVDRIIRGETKEVSVGRVELPDASVDRYFLNIADIHLSAKVGMAVSSYKFLGALCYVAATFIAFYRHLNHTVSLRVDGGDWSQLQQMTMVAVANAQFFGGGMKIAPSAAPFAPTLEVVTVEAFQWYHFLPILLKLFQGKHYGTKGISHQTAIKLEIIDPSPAGPDGNSNILVEADGECIGTLPATFTVLPLAINLVV